MTVPEHPLAGNGAVVLDIGDDVGALIVLLPDDLVGREVEILPAGGSVPDHGVHDHADRVAGAHEHAHEDDHAHLHEHDHDHADHDHDHADHDHGAPAGTPHGDMHVGHHHPPGTPPHVGVVPRLMGGRMVPTAVFGDLGAGRYDLRLRPGTSVVTSVDVAGGTVTTVEWPTTGS